MKKFHVTNFSKGRRHVSYVLQIEDGAVVERSVPFCFYFNKDVQIFNSTVLYMFETIRLAPHNRKAGEQYDWVIDIAPDVDIVEMRKGYENLLLADGTGLDSHAIRMLGGKSGKLRYVTIADLKGIELANIDQREFDTNDSVVMVGENYLWNRYVGDVLIDFSHDGNRLYSLMLLIDHFRAKKVLTADCEKLEYKSYFGATTSLYSCNFLYGDIGTSYVNARLDPTTYYDRILNCGHYPPYKNLRKFLVAKYLQTKYGVGIFTPEMERDFLSVNGIDIAGKPGIVEIVKGYKQQKVAAGGLQLFDDFILALNTIDLSALRQSLVQTPEQAKEFEALVEFAQAEYLADRRSYDKIVIFEEDKLREAFGDDEAFLTTVLAGVELVRGDDLVTHPPLPQIDGDASRDWMPVEKIAAMARAADGLKSIVLAVSIESSSSFTFSVYYTNGNSHRFLPRQHVDARVKPGCNDLVVKIPVFYLDKLRIDFGAAPGLLRVSPVTVRGIVSVTLDWREFSFHDVEGYLISKDGSLALFSKGKDPFAVCSVPLNLLAPASQEKGDESI